jgi:hypothetical protein
MKRLFLLSICALPIYATTLATMTVQEALYTGGTTGVSRTNAPTCFSVPLSDAQAVSSLSGLGLTGASNQFFKVLGSWSDGNYKWVEACGTISSFTAGGTATVTLTNTGSGSAAGMAADSDPGNPNSGTITVATGTATFTITKAHFDGIDVATVGSTPVVLTGTSLGLVIMGPVYPATSCGTCTTIYASSYDSSSTVTIEENGASRVVVNAQGALKDSSGDVYLRYTVRLYFYASSSAVKATVILRNADYGTSNTFQTAYKGFQGFELRIAPNISGTLSYTAAADPTQCTSGVCTGSLTTGTDSLVLDQEFSSTMQNPDYCNTGADHVPCVPYTATWPATGSDLGYTLKKDTTMVASDTTGNAVVGGWADIANSSGVGVEIGIYQMSALNPKSLEFQNGNDVRIGIWAPENSLPYYIAWPAYQIHDVWMNFHASALTSSAMSAAFLSFQHPLVGRLKDWTIYNADGVFPLYPLVNPTTNDNYITNLMATAFPAAITNYTYSYPDASPGAGGGGPSSAPYPLRQEAGLYVYRYYNWPNVGGGNQMEFHLSNYQAFLTRGYTGRYLDAQHFYRMVAEQGFVRSDGFSWLSYPSQVDSTGYPIATSTNGSLTFRFPALLDTGEHAHWYGIMDDYYLTGDETLHDAITGAGGYASGPTSQYLHGVSPWNARATGTLLMSQSRLAQFLTETGNSNATAMWNAAEGSYVTNVQPSLAIPDPSHSTFGLSRSRGVFWGPAQGNTETDCNGVTNRFSEDFMVSELLEGIWELHALAGPAWTYYGQSLDYAYGMSQWLLTEMYPLDGTNSYESTVNGFHYVEFIDEAQPTNCSNPTYDWQAVVADQTVWYPFFIQAQYTGQTAIWKQQFDLQLQRDWYQAGGDEFGGFTMGNVINLIANPPATSLLDVPVAVTNTGGGSYTLNWTPPTGVVSYRLKTDANPIVDLIGYNPLTNRFVGNPATMTNWFAATDASPTPAYNVSTITLTGLPSSGQQFALKALVSGGGGSTTPPVVSVTSPAGGASVLGTITVAATATDQVGIASVNFLLDNTSLGLTPVVAGSSYTASWNTTATSNGSHTLTAVATDTAGNTAANSVSIDVNNPPVISSVAATAITGSGATITWTTNTAADSQVAYGTTPAYGSTSALASTLTTAHVISLTGLLASTTYHAQALSRDAQGNLSSSADITFTTGAQSGSGYTWVQQTPGGYPVVMVSNASLAWSPLSQQAVSFIDYHERDSETNESLVAYSYRYNRRDVLDMGTEFHSAYMPEGGHPDASLAYDSSRQTLIYESGGSGSQQMEMSNHEWEYDPVGQSGRDRYNYGKPKHLQQDAGVYDPTHNVYLDFGGSNGGTWQVNTSTNVWTNISPSYSPSQPSGFSTILNHSMAFRTKNSKIYLFGGIISSVFQNWVWTYDVPTTTWTQLSPTGTPPSPRCCAGWAYDSTNDIFMLFAGDAGGTNVNDTWIFDPNASSGQGSWTQLSPSASPAICGGSGGLFQFLVYDPTDNVFIVDSQTTYFNSEIWTFRYAGSGPSAGYAVPSFTTPAASQNFSPTGWAREPVLAVNGSTLYLGHVETGTPFAGNNSLWPHMFVSAFTGGAWTNLGADYTAITGNTSGEDMLPSLAFSGGALWESNDNTELGTGTDSLMGSLWAKSWNGSGCTSAWCGTAIAPITITGGEAGRRGRSKLIDVNGTPWLAFLEVDSEIDSSLYVENWSGSAWVQQGGKLNKDTTSAVQFAESMSLANDSNNDPWIAWTEYSTATTNPQVYVAHWNGSAWAAVGTSLNISTGSGYAYDVSLTTIGTQPYVAWVERTLAGNPQLYVKTYSGGTWSQLGSGWLNRNTANGWAYTPSLTNDGTNIYVGWVEHVIGSPASAYMDEWNTSSWVSLGGALNSDAVNGSAQAMSTAYFSGNPVAAWGEVNPGNMRQVYVKTWNGSVWTALGASGTPPPTCDLNGDGTVNVVDVQIAINQTLGYSTCTNADLQQNGTCTVVDVQRVINAALGGACVVGP